METILWAVHKQTLLSFFSLVQTALLKLCIVNEHAFVGMLPQLNVAHVWDEFFGVLPTVAKIPEIDGSPPKLEAESST